MAEGSDSVVVERNAHHEADAGGAAAAAAEEEEEEDAGEDFQIAVAARRMSNMKNIFSSWVVVTEKAADCKVVVDAVLKGMKKHVAVADVQRYESNIVDSSTSFINSRALMGRTPSQRSLDSVAGCLIHADVHTFR